MHCRSDQSTTAELKEAKSKAGVTLVDTSSQIGTGSGEFEGDFGYDNMFRLGAASFAQGVIR